MIYDAIMRVPYLSWVIFCTSVQSVGLVQYFNTASLDWHSAMHVVMCITTIISLALFAFMVIVRTRPSAKASGVEPRVSALAGSLLVYGIVLFPRHDLSPLAESFAILLAVVGSTGATIALWQLGRSFSIMAESRKLVTTGPYRFVRHPLYVTEELMMIGVFIQFASVWTALIFAAHVAFQLRRICNEEAILSTSFPEYEAYRKRAARLIPGLY